MGIFGIAKKGLGLLGKAKKKADNMSNKTAGTIGMVGTAGAVVGGGEALKRKKKKKSPLGQKKYGMPYENKYPK